MFILLKTLWVLSFCVLLLSTCKHPEPEVRKDPCAQARPFTADFSIKEQVSDSLVITNTVLQYSYVTFEAAGDYDSYEWQIGYSTETYTTKQVRLLFTQAFGKLPIRLIARGKPNPCLASDDGIDTLTQEMNVVSWSKSPLIGQYEGYFDSDRNQTDKQTVTLTFEPNDYDEFGAFYLANINKGCNVPEREKHTWYVADVRGNAAVFSTWYGGSSGSFYNGCWAPYIWLKLQSKDTLVADFTYGERDGNNRYKDKFIGRRIQ